MRIKTITCHNVYNAGASLQAYALQTYLETLGHDVEIIDYVPRYLKHYGLWGGAWGKYDKPFVREAYSLAHLPGRIFALFEKRKSNFDAFARKYLKLTSKRYTCNIELDQMLPLADVYLAGSDQIWNTKFKNGLDPAFYLAFVPKSKVRASYAASFATESVQECYQEFVKGALSGLDFISVREKSGLSILETLGFKSGVNVLDPVFLLDKAVWEKMAHTPKSDSYIFVYAFEGGELIQRYAMELAKKTGLKIWTLQDLGYGDRCFKDAGPMEFLSLLYNAEWVLSNSFHATAFSIIFHKQFRVFNRSEKINTRMRDLVDSLGIRNALVDENDKIAVDEKLDYDGVDSRLAFLVDESKKYLDKVIEYAQGTD